MVLTQLPTATAETFFRVLAGLLPRGLIWDMNRDRISGRRLPKLLYGLAAEVARFHGRINDALIEFLPWLSTETLSAWERNFGLPECPDYPVVGVVARRAALGQKVAMLAGASNADYFSQIATSLGVTATITEPMAWPFAWQVETPECDRMTCEDDCETILITWTDLGMLLRCWFEKYRPAHTWIFWTGP